MSIFHYQIILVLNCLIGINIRATTSFRKYQIKEKCLKSIIIINKNHEVVILPTGKLNKHFDGIIATQCAAVF